jgi:hypothetical protein
MDYRVSATDPQPPARGVALIGGISALALAVSPTLVWWSDTAVRFFGAPGSLRGPAQVVTNYVGSGMPIGRMLIFFGLLCLPLWVAYGRHTVRWMRPVVAHLVIILYLTCALGYAALLIYAVLKQKGLPGLYPGDNIGPGLYLALGASLTQSGCLIWLIYERLAWAKMQKRRG